MKKKIVMQALALAMVASNLVACGPRVVDKSESTKTQIYISAYDAGYGREWLDTFAEEFAKMHEETEFEEGKKGLQVWVDWNQNNSSTLIGSLGSNSNDIFFNGYNYYELVNSGRAMDITSWLKEDMASVGEPGKTIENKIDEYSKAYLTGVGGNEGKYFAFPAYETYEGITYDADVFANYSLYIKEGGGFTGDLSEAAAGPDGQAGTYDDGLPATFDEFFAMCDQALLNSVIPMTGAANYYSDMIARAIWVNEEGADSAALNFTFDGTAKTLINVDGDTVTPIEDTVITDENAYMLMKQKGYYTALQFVQKLVKGSEQGSYLSKNTFSEGQTHLNAQEEYVYSNIEEAKKTPIAMFFEGSYWTMEADSAFNTAANMYDDKYARENRNFKWMPMPFASAEGTNLVGEKKNTTVAGDLNAFVNKKVESASAGRQEAIKQFILWMNTDEKILDFANICSYNRALKMPELSLDSAEYKALTPFAQSMYDVRNSWDIVYPFSSNATWIKNSGDITQYRNTGWMFNGGTSYMNTLVWCNDNKDKNISLYFNAMFTTKQNSWSNRQ